MVEIRSITMALGCMGRSDLGLIYQFRGRGKNIPFQKSYGESVTNTMLIITSDGASMVLKKVSSHADKYRYSTEPFAGANGQIPQLNLWDDHDVSI